MTTSFPFNPQSGRANNHTQPSTSRGFGRQPTRQWDYGLRNQVFGQPDVGATGRNNGRSNGTGKKNTNFFQAHQPARVEKGRKPDDRSYSGLGRPGSAFQKKKGDLNATLDAIIGDGKNSSIDKMIKDHTEDSLDRLIASHKFRPSVDEMLREGEEREREAQRVAKEKGKAKAQGYQRPTVEDSMDIDPPDKFQGNKPLSTGAVLEQISPGTVPERTVHWAENIAGPSGTGQPGLKSVPSKPAIVQHVSHFNKDGPSQSPWGSTAMRDRVLQQEKEKREGKVPTIQGFGTPGPPPPSSQSPWGSTRMRDLVMQKEREKAEGKVPTTLGFGTPAPPPASNEPPKPKKTYTFGTPSVHPTKVPSPPPSPRRSSRLQMTGAVPAPVKELSPKRTYKFGIEVAHPAKLPSPPPSPRRSPRLNQTETTRPEKQLPSWTRVTPATPVPAAPRATPTKPLPASIPTQPIQPIDPSLSQPLVKAELDFLRSDNFDPSLIRPVPDLSQAFESITSTFGEPGTGLLQTRFVPLSPKKAGFATGATKSGAAKDCKVRKYSISPTLKSRHIDIELLRSRISHAMLLSFNLSPDARRDAISIGDLAGIKSVPGPSLVGRSSARNTDPKNRYTSRVEPSSKGSEHIGMGILNGRIGNRRRNSDKDAWIIVNGQRKRRRESDGDKESREREIKINREKTMARVIARGDMEELKRTSKESSDGSNGSDGSGTTNVMTWRIVRVSAIVEVDGKVRGTGNRKMEEIQTAWWAVPERAIVGMF